MGAISFTLDPQLVHELRRHLPFTTFVETGTFRGETLEIMHPLFDDCLSVELSDEHYKAAQQRFGATPNIRLFHGDSAKFLRENQALYAGKSTLFWLDAHWCVGGDSNEKSQCPLLQELAAIKTLNAQSALLIDDARLFLAPPPKPHEISDWPSFDSILEQLHQLSREHAVICFNDVIVYVPKAVQASLRTFLYEHTTDLLSISDKARHYDKLLAQAKDKDIEIAALKKAGDEREQLILDHNQHYENFRAHILRLEEALTIKTKIADEYAGKDVEIALLKKASDEREQLVLDHDQHYENFRAHILRLEEALTIKDRAIAALEKSGGEHQAEAESIKTRLVTECADRDVQLKRETAELRASLQNHATGHATVEQAKHFGRQLAEKESVIQSLHRACLEREKLILQLAASATTPTAKLHKLWVATSGYLREKFWHPLSDRAFKKIVEDYWMQIGILQHYEPRPITWDKLQKSRRAAQLLPQIAVVTPSFNQAAFIESTLLSVLNQKYPKLLYVVQDGGSKDASPQIIARYSDRLTHWESAPDHGQADAICKGFARVAPKLDPDDVMAWLNSDDLMAPRALHHVAEFFARHPKVDVVYGHRIIIDGVDHEIGRWIMPRHDPRSLEWIDYVPQETLFWRKRAWDLVGGLDPSFQFALDWDLLARFTQAGLHVVRLPYFLGCFRVHHEQKTSQHIHSTGADEMARVRTRFHGPERQGDMETINTWARRIRFQGALTARLHALGIRW
ncbi:MAG TPA: glycosyltransferase [Opitutaceae bacterium]|jgi:GT2 family glycosyltransferase|nr:glycosyltransferase [Opitutaceae bacterium]